MIHVQPVVYKSSATSAAVCCSVLQCVAVYCSVLQCAAVCCIVLQPIVYKSCAVKCNVNKGGM